MSAYRAFASKKTLTPQTQPIPGRETEMVQNAAGGYVFQIGDWERLERFLIIGSDGGTYYASGAKLTAENAASAIRCIKEDGERAVKLAYDINIENRAPKVDAQLFVLALAMKHGDALTKVTAEMAAHEMLRTGTHLLHFVSMLDGLGGWSRAKRRIVADWFTEQAPEKLAYQLLKYQQRDGWSMRDVLRVSHPETGMIDVAHKALFDFVCGRGGINGDLPEIVQHYLRMREALTESLGVPTAKQEIARLALYGIEHNLPREALPTEALAMPEVWKALLPKTPSHALLRNLGNLASQGLFDDFANVTLVANAILNRNALAKSRVHPFAVLLASLVFQGGRGIRGSKTWVPNNLIISALDDAYDASFKNVSPTGKRILVAIDISGSMTADCAGLPISASTAAAAMALTIARLEPQATVVQFDTEVRRIVPMTKRTGISGLAQVIGGGTDIAAPIRWAAGQEAARRHYDPYSRYRSGQIEQPLPAKPQAFDAIVILTDNETWAGRHGHTVEILTQYRAVHGPAKLVVCAMSATGTSVVDGADPLSFGCAGLDTNLPSLVSEFIGH